jgi:hypothetical protein
MPTLTTAIPINGINTWDEGVSVTYARGNATTAQRNLRCAWSDGARLAAYLKGGANIVGGVTIYSPAQAFSQDLPNLFPESVNCEGEGQKSRGADGWMVWERAVVTIRYSPLGIEETGSQDLDFGKEIVSLPGDRLKFASGSDPLPFSVPISIPTVCVQQSRANMATLPIPTILAATAAPLDNSGLFGSQTETLLFDGGRAVRAFTTGGATNWTVQYRFLYRPAPMKWGWFLNSAGTPEKVLRKDGTELYAKSNLSALFL